MAQPGSSPAMKKHSPLLLGCAGLLLLLFLIATTVAITFWWIQRPIRPVVLSAQENATLETKVRELESRSVPIGRDSTPSFHSAPAAAGSPVQQSAYVPGSTTIKLTEREINGLLNKNTDLGNKVRLEFDKDAVNAYMAIPVPEDFPVGAGTTFRMRGRFRISIGGEGRPYAVLEDVTIFGLSLPKEWLGGIKGENLLGEALGDGPVVQGIKSLKVEPGALILEVGD